MEMAPGDIRACLRQFSIQARLKAPPPAPDPDTAAEALPKPVVLKVLEDLYRDHPGPVWRASSRRAMEDKVGRGPCLIYGEVSFVAFARLLDRLANYRAGSHGFTFYDLGCGSGRPVLMTALLSLGCAKACGIDIVPEIHGMNQELLQLYDVEVRPLLHPARKVQDISFVLGDFLKLDWSDADIIFTNATCFDHPLFQRLEELATQVLRPGALVVSVTKRFMGGSWELLDQQERRMSWASAMVFVQRKRGSSMETQASYQNDVDCLPIATSL